MKKPTTTVSPSKFYCDIFGHNYKQTRQVTHFVKEYTCSCCKKQLTTDGNGRLTELTPKYKDINAVLAKIYATKLARLKQKRYNISAA